MRTALISAITALAATAGLLGAYHRWLTVPPLRIGLVDIADVYRTKEAEFSTLVTRAANDDERERAMRMARAFAQRLPLALAELPAECDCLVVVKATLAAPSPAVLDLTPQLRAKLESR